MRWLVDALVALNACVGQTHLDDIAQLPPRQQYQ